jgi:penicillin-binding protein 1A
MSGRLTAGEPLVPHPPHAPAPKPERPREKKPRRPAPPGKNGNGKKRPHWVFRTMGGLVAAVFGVVVLAGLAAGVFAWTTYQRIASDLPTVDGLRTYQPPVMSRVYASDSRLIGELATERRIFVPFTAIPDQVKQAFVAAEDKTFWTHRGVDPAAILRAAVTDIQMMGHGRRPIGASTITQQVAKNMLLGNNSVTLSRKIKEAILATRIENTLTKERILELYLNEIYLGIGSYGVASAAQSYFNKPLDQLSLAQAAFLGALPKAPNNYNPFRFPDAAKARRDWVLDRMAEDHYVTPEQAAAAKAEPIAPAPYSRPETLVGSEWFAEEVKRELIDHYGNDVATEGGLSVRTTLDPTLQVAADKALRDGLINYDHRHGNWRGAVAHLNDNGALRTGWPTLLASVAKPAGLLPSWRLGVVLESRGDSAQLGYLEPVAGGEPGETIPRNATLSLSESLWARHNGATPHRMADIVRPGDVVMIEPQAAATTAVPAPGAAPAKQVARSDRALLRQIPIVQGAMVAIDPHSGRVLAMSGGWSHDSSQFNRATQALRQPGSSFKPFVYLTGMMHDISPSQRFLDAPFVQDLGAQGVWAPHDFEKGFLGEVPLHVALEKSLNLPTVRLAEKLGMGEVAKTAIAFHVVDSMPKVLPAALGAVETTALRAAGAYAGLATEGKEVIPTLVDTVQDRDGHVIWRNPGLACTGCNDPSHPPAIADQRKQIADPASTFQIIKMMEGVVQHGTGTEAAKGMGGREIAGKTGTSQDFNDAWFDGFTPDLVTVVWIGFDQPSSLGDNQTGGEVAAPLWRDFMQFALKDHPMLSFPQPEGVTVQSWDSGFGRVTDAFKPGQEPGASAPSGGGNGGGNGDTGNLTASAGDGSDTGDAGAPTNLSSATPPANGPRKLDSDMGGLY